MAEKWSEQFCIYTSEKDAQKSIREYHDKTDGESVARVKILVESK